MQIEVPCALLTLLLFAPLAGAQQADARPEARTPADGRSSGGAHTPTAASACTPGFVATFGSGAGSATTGLNQRVLATVVHDDGSGPALFVGGEFTQAAGQGANRVAKWDGSAWSPLGAGLNAPVRALASYDDGSVPALFVGGEFTLAGGMPASRIARWDGTSWSALEQGVNERVYALHVHDDGSGPALYVGGRFTTAGGAAAVGIARWDGSSWSSVAGGMSASYGSIFVKALADFDDGSGVGPRLYAAGSFHQAGGLDARGIARWDGSSWSALGWLGIITWSDGVMCLAAHDDGSGPALYAGGSFFMAGGLDAWDFARWNGTEWQVPPGPGPYIHALVEYDDGTGVGPMLYAGGEFFSGGGVMQAKRWNGSTWSSLGPAGVVQNHHVRALAVYDQPGTGPSLVIGSTLAAAPEGDSYLSLWGGCAGELGEAYCFGDGSGIACPCDNTGGAGEGCANSTGHGATLGASGSSSVAADELHFHAAQLPAGSFAQLYVGSLVPMSGAGLPFGDGLRCAGGQIVRLDVKPASPSGEASYGPTHPVPGGWFAGTTRYFQVHYRNSSGPCGSGFNFSGALQLDFTP